MEGREAASHLQEKVQRQSHATKAVGVAGTGGGVVGNLKSETGEGLVLVIMADWNGSWLRNTFLPRQLTACKNQKAKWKLTT